MIQIELTRDDGFNIVRETLTRIGQKSKRDKVLYQTAHILHKRGKLYICHFKELFELDGKETDITDSDVARRNTIADLLQEWGLIKILNPEIMEIRAKMKTIGVVSFREKDDWTFVPKYTIGKNDEKH